MEEMQKNSKKNKTEWDTKEHW